MERVPYTGMSNMTVKQNHERIVRLEDDFQEIQDRLTSLEIKHIDLMARLDTIASGVKIILAIVGASLGIDVGIEGGMI
jgi:tetrahydromethanopterin S-methyltransferase subunit G